MTNESVRADRETRLDSWKAIAAYLNRDVRTVMRWEKSEQLPVRRHRHLTRSSVYAYPAELDAWRANRGVIAADAPQARTRSRLFAVATIAFVSLVCAGGGRVAGSLLAPQEGPADHSIGWPGNARMAMSASLSWDGRYVAYVAARPDTDLHVRDLESGADRRLTRIQLDGGYVDASAISRDSRWVAFVARDRDARGVPGKLEVLPLSATDATPPRVLVEGQWPVPQGWSADGSQLLVTTERDDGKFDLALVTVASGASRVLKTLDAPGPGEHVCLSPDDAFVAYDARPRDNVRQRDIFLVPTRGGPATSLLDGPSSDRVVGWSPDGRYLVFLSDRQGSDDLWAVPVANGRRAGDPVLLRKNFVGDTIDITARGDLFYEGLANGASLPSRSLLVATVDPDAGSLVKAPWFAAHDRQADTRSPRWSADGRLFMYVTQRPAGPVISIRSEETGIVREVPLNLGYFWTFDWSPDGSSLVFRASDLQNRQGVFLVDTRTGDVRTLVYQSPNRIGYNVPQFSTDGRTVTCFKNEFEKSERPGWRSYVALDVNTGTERVLHDDLRALMTSRYPMGRSPDGRYLLASQDYGSASALVVYDAKSGTTREVLRVNVASAFNYEGGLQWMPDSRAFVVNTRSTKENERALWWVPLDGRQPHTLNIGRSDLVDRAVAIHPDGKQIAFVAGDPVVSKTSVLHTEFRLLERFLPSGLPRSAASAR